MTDQKVKALQEEIKILKRFIVGTVIALVTLIIFLSFIDYSSDRYVDEEMNMMMESSEWHQVTDTDSTRRIIASIKMTKIINDKDKTTYIAMNKEKSKGVAVFSGRLKGRKIVTFDFSDKEKKVKVRFACLQ